MHNPLYVVDIEANRLKKADKIWTLSYSKFVLGKKTEITTLNIREAIIAKLKEWEAEKAIIIGHNFILYDLPTINYAFGTNIKLTIYDSLPFSWYLYPDMPKHGLEVWGEKLGFPKVVVPDTEWIKGDLKLMTERCETDVQINYLLFEQMYNDMLDLYDHDEALITKVFNYLSFLMEVFRHQEINSLVLDVQKCKENLFWFDNILQNKITKLKSLMPPREVIKTRKMPKNMTKKDGSDSALALKWFDFLQNYGLPDDHTEPVDYVSGYEEPNPGSNTQIKAWLFANNWEPQTYSIVYETEKNEGGKKVKTGNIRRVPQIKKDGQLCPSVELLAEKIPELVELVDYGVVTHRMGLLKGFLKNVNEDGTITAGIAGLTSTLRIRHKVLVNLPGVTGDGSIRDGQHIRGVLTAGKGFKFIGQDVSNLEGNCKIHYITPFDPEYAKLLSDPSFDEHLSVAKAAGYIDDEDIVFFKTMKKLDKKSFDSLPPLDKVRFKNISLSRKEAKPINFGGIYGLGAKTLQRNTGWSMKKCQFLIKTYRELNWSVFEFPKHAETKEAVGKTWIKNPVNNYWYILRGDKDRFSALNQGLGSYVFFLWQYFIIRRGNETISANFHDEGVYKVPDNQEEIDRILKLNEDAMEDVNNYLKLHVRFKVDGEVGNTYADVH